MTNAPAPATTIAAIATPPGRGGVGVVRISGALVRAIANTLLDRLPPPRYATLSAFYDRKHRVLDQGLAVFFPAPHSYTGEDVLELHAHGGPVLLDMLLREIVALGATHAQPGEFSQRAFLNGKLDLTQAEAVADLIDSGSESAARSAVRSLQGEFSRRVQGILAGLVEARTHVEAAIDFPEEEIDFLADPALAARLGALSAEIDALFAATRQGCLLRDGMTIALAGRPNAGKSSLLNALAQRDSAIVSDVPGTTRDVLREYIQIDGLPLHIVDTAGLRPANDALEGEGVRRALAALAQADHALVLLDDTHADDIGALLAELPPALAFTLVRNKIDLTQRPAGATANGDVTQLAISCKTGAGLDALRQHLKTVAGFEIAGTGTFTARRRHLDAIERARCHLRSAQTMLAGARGELVAEELRLAQQSLGEVTGEFTADDLLGRIFASFCIGK